VLRDGTMTAYGPRSEIDLNWIVRHMVGEHYDLGSPPTGYEFGPVMLSVRNLTVPEPAGAGYNVVDKLSLDVRAGEIVCIYGLMGAGRTELFECIFGLQPQATGKVGLAGTPLDGKTIPQRLASGLALIPEDRKTEGLVSHLSIGSNLTLSSLHSLARWCHIGASHERTTIRSFIRDLVIKAADPDLEVSSLSGGNQQKVVIGRALMTRPKVLLMDEPSRGIDIGAKADVFKVMRDLASAGLGILFVTSDLEEVMALSDRILVMSNGRITAEFSREQASQESLVRASAAGH
jgi:erythritol transport system ATP-binding protein